MKCEKGAVTMKPKSWAKLVVALYALAGTLLGIFPCTTNEVWAQVNQTIEVEAKRKDNPQENPDHIEGHFTNPPTGDTDIIHVLGAVRGVNVGVYNDPVNDGAVLIMVMARPVEVNVECREGIGAIYWVTVRRVAGRGGAGPVEPLWADVKDMEEPGSLVLKDTVSGRAEVDRTNADDAPTLFSSTEQGKGKVEFQLFTNAGTFDWTIIRNIDQVVLFDAVLNEENNWTDNEKGFDLGLYTLTVRQDGNQEFERKIIFAVGVEILKPLGSSDGPWKMGSALNGKAMQDSWIRDKARFDFQGVTTASPAPYQPVEKVPDELSTRTGDRVNR